MATKNRRRAAGRRTSIIKAEVLGGGDSSSALADYLASSDESLPGGAIPPPYDFQKLYSLYESSSILRPNVDAYVTNIDSFGHHFVPTIDLDAEDADVRISEALLYERAMAVNRGELNLAEVTDPTPEEIAERKENLRKVASIERSRLKAFFSFVCPDMSFTELRRRTRQDYEVLGNAFWEPVRNELGEVTHFYYAPPLNMRLMPLDSEPVEIEERVRVTDVTWATIKRPHRFRRYLQISGAADPIYFKEFGDPRVVSRKSGKYYKDLKAMKAEEPEACAATEILHWRIFTPNSAYGIPRWIGTLSGVLGGIELDQVNLNYFKNNVVPPLALLVSGGRFGKGVSTKIEEFIDEHLKGRKGVHRILVLEAEGQKAAGQTGPKAIPKVQFVPLRDAQQSDALFQNYDARNEDKVAKTFRLPRILRGDDTKINRATAYASLKFADEQIFEPERETFDDVMNRKVFPILGVSFWLFRSNAPVVRDPEKMAEMLERMVKGGILLPKEARMLASDIFNRQFVEISEDWTNRPLPIVLAQLRSSGKNKDLEVEPTEDDDDNDTPRPSGGGQGTGNQPGPGLLQAGTPLQPLGAHDGDE